MAAFPRAYRSSATHRNGGTAGHRRATPSQTTGRTYSDVGTGIHNAKVEGIKEGGELPRLCNFIAESAIRFLSKLSCRWRRSYRAAHHLPKAFEFIESLFAAFPVRAGFSFRPFFPPFRQYRHGAGTRPEKPSNAFPENVLCRRRTSVYAGSWRVAPAFLRPCGSVSKHVTSSQAASGRAADPFTAGALPGRRVREGFPPFADNTKEP